MTVTPRQTEGAEVQTPEERFDRLLDVVAKSLNAVHKTDHSRRYWGILLYRYLAKCMIVEESGIGDRRPPSSPPDDEAVLGPRGGEKGKPGGSARKRGPIPPLAEWPRSWSELRDSLRVRALWKTPISRARNVLCGFPYYHVISRYIAQPAATWVDEAPRAIREEPAKRLALQEMLEKEEGPLARVALEWLPRWYVEEFQDRAAGVRVERPSEKAIHGAFLSSVDSRFFSARYVTEGSTLSIYQHAVGYGELKGHVLQHAETSLADRFMTWGWQHGPKDVPFLALRLMTPRKERIHRVRGGSSWIYVNLRQPFTWLLPQTLEAQDRFFGALREPLARRIVIRARVSKGGIPEDQVSDRARNLIQAIDPSIEPWYMVVGHAALVILDLFPSAAFLECLMTDVPVIAIVPPERMAFTPQADAFYEKFFRAGVLHRTPESAATFLNGLDVESWWRSVREQDWLTAYQETFSCISEPR